MRTGVFKCKEVGRIMTFLFSCLAIHTEAFLFLCHSGWHIINSCLICCLRALLPMQEALNPYTAVRDKTPVGPLPPRFNNKTEESSTQQSISGFSFRSTYCYSLHKCHLQRSRRMLHIKSSHQPSDLQISTKGRLKMVSVLQREKRTQLPGPLKHLCTSVTLICTSIYCPLNTARPPSFLSVPSQKKP